MFTTQIPRNFLVRREGQKGRNAYTQAYVTARENDRATGTDAPFLIGQQPIDTMDSVAPKQALTKPETEAQVLSEELLSNDSLGG